MRLLLLLLPALAALTALEPGPVAAWSMRRGRSSLRRRPKYLLVELDNERYLPPPPPPLVGPAGQQPTFARDGVEPSPRDFIVNGPNNLNSRAFRQGIMTTVEGDNNKFGTNAIIYGSNGSPSPDSSDKNKGREENNNDEDVLDDDLEIHPLSPPSRRLPKRPFIPPGFPSFGWNPFGPPQPSHFYGNPYFNIPSPYGPSWPFQHKPPSPYQRNPTFGGAIAPPPNPFGKYPLPPPFGKFPPPAFQTNPQPQQRPSYPGNPWLAAGVGFIPGAPPPGNTGTQTPPSGGGIIRPIQGGASSTLSSGGNEIKGEAGGPNGGAPGPSFISSNGDSNSLSAGGNQAPSITTNENGEAVLNSGGGGDDNNSDIVVDDLRPQPPAESGGSSSSSGSSGRGGPFGVSASASAWGPWRKDPWNRNRMAMGPYQYNQPY